jgi:hypothetical protein
MDVLDVWYARLDDSDVLAMLPQGRKALLSVRMPRPVTLGRSAGISGRTPSSQW